MIVVTAHMVGNQERLLSQFLDSIIDEATGSMERNTPIYFQEGKITREGKDGFLGSGFLGSLDEISISTTKQITIQAEATQSEAAAIAAPKITLVAGEILDVFGKSEENPVRIFSHQSLKLEAPLIRLKDISFSHFPDNQAFPNGIEIKAQKILIVGSAQNPPSFLSVMMPWLNGVEIEFVDGNPPWLKEHFIPNVNGAQNGRSHEQNPG